MSDIPAQIGRYRVEAVLGRGAMGVIYRAHDPDIDRPVALKLIRADLLASDERADYIARFRREAQAAARCTHPNIVTIYDFALHEGNPFLAMEFVDGVSLAQAREHCPRFEPADAVFVLLQVLDALGAAHAMGIIHRDIKPANIMLMRGSHVKVTDFGISRIEGASLTGDGSLIGTPSYMSPEQARSEGLDGRSDLFSATAVLFEMLAGAKLFPRLGVTGVLGALVSPEVIDLSPLDAIPPGLRAVVARGLAKPVGERFANAGAMASALRVAMADVGAELSDRTIVLPAVRDAGLDQSGTATGTSVFDPATLETLTRSLTQFVGPIAGHLVRSAARREGSLDGLCGSLLASIERPDHRLAFEKLARQTLGRSDAGSSQTRAMVTAANSLGVQITSKEIAHLTAALAVYLGPIARVMVKRAMPSAASAEALWQGLAQSIEQPEARAAFLRQKQ